MFDFIINLSDRADLISLILDLKNGGFAFVSVLDTPDLRVVTLHSKMSWDINSRAEALSVIRCHDANSVVSDPVASVDANKALNKILRDRFNALGLGTEAPHTLSSDNTVIAADGVDAATVTVSPASGEYHWSLWLEGALVASSATLGDIDLADGYALEIAVSAAGTYTLRVIQDGKYKQITITGVA